MIQKNVVDYFLSLITISSESKNEKNVAEKLFLDLKELGLQPVFDKAYEMTGGNCGNLYAYLPGSIQKPPMLLCAHMDTVSPGNDIKPVVENGIIHSDGTTVLGSDDKSGIAEIMLAIKELKDSGEAHAPIELLFTISEEIGLLGAKYLDYSLLKSKFGYALDAHHVGEFMVGAPSQNSLEFKVHGKEAHAGVAPEMGINAIQVAAEAIAAISWGRIDFETTCNVGIINGGNATNVVPNMVQIRGEVRSHSMKKLTDLTQQIVNTFQETVDKYEVNGHKARFEANVHNEYHSFFFENEEPVVELAIQAARKIGVPVRTIKGGGGSDANIFNGKGISVIAVGTGMDKVHTVEECIEVSELENGTKWVKELIRTYSNN
ncbi:MAG TPA: M20/M25/M40 family metallo-hydrolase [Candidatus Cloacimonadota bacterium]|nr:M20/M25/M40 family metallo-hydrolase [Candidatus Cloacimonadota bacterium]HPT73229.1 M20/M25/M40 family metallo-hydrolase [Candidatus Cloacimonadota bacterium]